MIQQQAHRVSGKGFHFKALHDAGNETHLRDLKNNRLLFYMIEIARSNETGP